MINATSSETNLLQIGEVSTKSVRRWISSGDLAAVRLGRSLRISQSELARFVASRTLKKNAK